jgi:hypothetical protein
MTDTRDHLRSRSAAGTLVWLLAASSLHAASLDRDGPSWCGTTPDGLSKSLALNRYNESRLAQQRFKPQPTVNVDRNEIALLEDDGTILVRANTLDLANKTLVFHPASGGGLSLEERNQALSGSPGSPVSLGDDDSKSFTLGFGFPLGGQTYRQVFVNSDGNLTFTAADNASTDRSLSRFLSTPRVAGLFRDLNPSSSGTVSVESTGSSFTVTWTNVPEFETPQPNTFQIKLGSDGTVTLAYASLGTREAVIGVSPRADASPKATDLSKGSGSASASEALVETFTTQDTFDDAATAKAFYRSHPDAFEYLVIFNNLDTELGGGTFAYERPIKNQVTGIGLPTFNEAGAFGSAGRLESLLNMGPLSQYPTDPNVTFLGTNTTFDVFGQEAGHRFLAYPGFDDRGQTSDLLLGRASSHWSFCMDSDASDMEGNDWRDNGDGTFTTVDATSRYSLLDQYMWGLVPSSAVPATFFLTACDTNASRSRAPEIGVSMTSARRNVTIQEIVRANGQRKPAVGAAPTTWHMAFILIVKPGEIPPHRTLRQIDTIRRFWPEYFKQVTDNRGTMITTLDGGPEDTEPFPDDNGGGTSGGGSKGGGGCGSVIDVSGPKGGGPPFGTVLLTVGAALALAVNRKRIVRDPR